MSLNKVLKLKVILFFLSSFGLVATGQRQTKRQNSGDDQVCVINQWTAVDCRQQGDLASAGAGCPCSAAAPYKVTVALQHRLSVTWPHAAILQHTALQGASFVDKLQFTLCNIGKVKLLELILDAMH